MLRCMTVALNAAQEATCRHAIAPVEVIPCATVSDACASMSTVLPLLVVIDEETSDADRHALSEFAIACSAEIVSIERVPSGKAFISRMLEALRVAERRRAGKA